MRAGRRHCDLADQPVRFIHCHMGFIAMMRLVLFERAACTAAARSVVLSRLTAGRLQKLSVQQWTVLQIQAQVFQLRKAFRPGCNRATNSETTTIWSHLASSVANPNP